VSAYAPVPDFELLHVTAAAEVELPAEAVALCTSGGFTLSGSTGSAVITRGESLYISDEGPLAVTGNGSLFVAASGR
jgi:mannose-6-phosphate isomerase